jgi:hypothetical protein
MWVLIMTLGLVKVPIAVLMLWIPMRSDAALVSIPSEAPSAEDATAEDSSEEDDGGSKTLTRNPHDPRPYPHAPLPRRRGPHGSPPLPSPARVRTRRGGVTRVGSLR